MYTGDPQAVLGLGIDAGGTRTRWALADGLGAIRAEGVVSGFSALHMATGAGRERMHAVLAELGSAVLAQGRPTQVRAGVTGHGGESDQLQRWLAGAFDLAPAAVTLSSDIEIAYLASFAPGQGYLIYAGTGSIGAYIDSDGQFHRAGGRGVMLDDGGGGFWIAREALRHIWRNEDEAPGCWRTSPLAQAVFEQIGGDDWSLSRQFMYGQERGQVGLLALAVAASADADPVAAAILDGAGQELARLALALTARFGERPLALAGRVCDLHPSIERALRAALPASLCLAPARGQAHHAAARIAAGAHQGLRSA